jgi:hypothetical protein
LSTKPPGFVSLGEPRALAGEAALAQAAGPAEGARRTVALIVCHGMGQQVPFETIDAVARVLRRAQLRLGGGTAAPNVTTRIVDIGLDKPVGRAEIALNDAKLGAVDVHVYEAYWAPLTAGKVGLRHVVGFLLGAGVSGIRAAPHAFLRWMFNGWQEFPPSIKALFELLVAIAFVASLIVMNATIAAVVASRSIGRESVSWPSAELLDVLTIDFGVVLLFWALAGIALGAAYLFHEHIDEDQLGWNRDLLRVKTGIGLAKILVWLGIAATIVVGTALVWDLSWRASGSSALLCICSWLPGARCNLIGIPNWGIVSIWGLVLLLSYVIRSFMIEYVGDVVAYVNAHEASEFHDIREAIRKVAHDLGAAIYALRRPDNDAVPLYSRIVMAGHSLGSVIAYDTLNRLLLEDSWQRQPDVLRRTAALVTFGSPLDKTAFIFRSQKPVEAEVREALAAGVQPLIADAGYRQPIKWFNLWSTQDWISGRLRYYDENPPVTAWQVNNIEDEYADVPLLAHIMYWRSRKLAGTLLTSVRL